MDSKTAGPSQSKGLRQIPDIFDPANSTTRGIETLPFLHSGAVCPVSRRDWPRDWHQHEQTSDEDISLLQGPSILSPANVSLSADGFPKIMDESLQGGSRQKALSSAPKPYCFGRSTSSEYPSPDYGSPRMQSPVSTVCVNRLSFSDLGRFGHANDRLSFLASSSPASSTHDARADTSDHHIIDEAMAAISQWQDEPRPGKKKRRSPYELAESSEVLPWHSLSQQGSLTSSSDKLEHPARHVLNSVESIKDQFDGAAESHRPRSLAFSTARSASSTTDTASIAPRQSKRKASHFSLRSFTEPFAKRPRFLRLRKWASKICHGGGGRLSQAYHRWRQQNEPQRRQFEASKANRRKHRPAEALKGKSEKGFGAFSFEGSRFGNEKWWKEGVAKYRAPSWMLFRK